MARVARASLPAAALLWSSLAACGTQTAQPASPTAATEPAQDESAATEEVADTGAQAEQKTDDARSKADDSRAALESSMAERIRAGIAKMELEMDEEQKRWTPQFTADVAGRATKSYPDLAAKIDAALQSPHRRDNNAERDGDRHPTETLAFFGITPASHIVEIGPGKGWYTELLAFVTAGGGKLTITMGDPKGPPTTFGAFGGRYMTRFLDRSPELFGHVQRAIVDAPESIPLGPDGSADAVLILRRMHNWVRFGSLQAHLAATFKVLKSGGVVGIAQHRAAEGADPAVSAKSGYLPQAWVIEQVQAAGFKFVAASEINANPRDTKDYEAGVWALPPSLSAKGDKARYQAIGESDRMTLKFVKP